jgi:hypothetical protein
MPNGPATGSGTQSIERTVRNSFDAVACSMISTLADVLSHAFAGTSCSRSSIFPSLQNAEATDPGSRKR